MSSALEATISVEPQLKQHQGFTLRVSPLRCLNCKGVHHYIIIVIVKSHRKDDVNLIHWEYQQKHFRKLALPPPFLASWTTKVKKLESPNFTMSEKIQKNAVRAWATTSTPVQAAASARARSSEAAKPRCCPPASAGRWSCPRNSGQQQISKWGCDAGIYCEYNGVVTGRCIV